MKACQQFFIKVAEFHNSGRYRTYEDAVAEAERLYPDLHRQMWAEDKAKRAQFANRQFVLSHGTESMYPRVTTSATIQRDHAQDKLALHEAMYEQEAMLAEGRASLVGADWQTIVRKLENKLKGNYARDLFQAIADKLKSDGDNSSKASWNAASSMFPTLRAAMKENPIPAIIQNENDSPAARREKVAELVNKVMSKSPWLSYEQSFARVGKENPELFAAMKQPARLRSNSR